MDNILSIINNQKKNQEIMSWLMLNVLTYYYLFLNFGNLIFQKTKYFYFLQYFQCIGIILAIVSLYCCFRLFINAFEYEETFSYHAFNVAFIFSHSVIYPVKSIEDYNDHFNLFIFVVISSLYHIYFIKKSSKKGLY